MGQRQRNPVMMKWFETVAHENLVEYLDVSLLAQVYDEMENTRNDCSRRHRILKEYIGRSTDVRIT